MKRVTEIFFLLLLYSSSYGQSFLNGDFEINSAGIDQINLSNADFNAFMPDCFGFGPIENLDIITSSTYSGGPKNGNWYVGLTGGGTDLLSLKLSIPLIAGNSYTICFYDKKDVNFISLPIEIGLSTSNNSFGSLVYTASSSAVESIWTHRQFTFIAPIGGQYITVRQQGSVSNWVQVDSFSLDACETGIEMPNVFTPNNDGINDNFIPIKYEEIVTANLRILNRWGQELYYSDNLQNGWNGYFREKTCTEGVYYWIVQYTTKSNDLKELSGFLTILK